jgi:hypothetical protein
MTNYNVSYKADGRICTTLRHETLFGGMVSEQAKRLHVTLEPSNLFLPKVSGSSGHIVLQTQFNWTKMADYLHPPIVIVVVIVVVLGVRKQTVRAQPTIASERAENTGK